MRAGVVVASKYRLVRELGSGGMGSVWQAVHLVTEREFAIKFLLASSASNTGMLQRFFQEARVSGKLRHPSVIEIFDVGTAAELEGAPYLVMELLDGASLDVVVRKVGRLPPRLVLEATADVARALALAHEKGIVHRDLKPANIFLHRPGSGAIVPKVLDFGISKIATTPELGTGITSTGTVLGSPLYMSPEQAASDKTIDGRSDVHALGVVMWECLVGAPPFTADTYNNLVVQIMTGERPRLREALPEIDPAIAALVDRAMARRREDRFQSAAELAEAIDAQVALMPGVAALASRSAAAELFARVGKASTPPEASLVTTVGSTTGGVAVPSSREPARPTSPVAASLHASPSHEPLAYEKTHQVAPPSAAPLDATVAQPPLAGAPVSAVSGGRSSAQRTRPRGPVVAGIAAGVLLVAGVAIVVPLALRRSTPSTTPPVESTQAAASFQTPAAPSQAPASPSATASSATSATVPPAPRPALSHAASPPPAWRVPPPARPSAKRPDDSVESSGFR